MGDPLYIEKIAGLYGVKISNITLQQQKDVLMLVKHDLTKKEYKSYFQFANESDAIVLEKLHCDEAQLTQYRKKAEFKLKKDLLKNSIVALLAEKV